ncbi:MAG: hypothetical protein OXB98_05965 [Bryobacterales bacterium]|nr:hypothetical protein [Bryobacterales bacterium]
MANTTTTTDPKKTGLFAALRSAHADEFLAYNAVEEVRSMAGDSSDSKYAVLTARIDSLEATVKALDSKFDSKFDALNSSLSSLRWIIGVLLVPISLSVLGTLGLLLMHLKG